MATIRQTSLAGGELAPNLWSRDDLEKYMVGARVLKNFIVDPRGAAVNRPGTPFIAEVKASATTHHRLIRFMYANDLAFDLLFGDQYIRVFRNGARVGTVEIATPYAAADLPRLKFAQYGAILTLTHPSYTPRDLELTSTDGTTWSIGLTPCGMTLSSPVGIETLWINNWVAGWATTDTPKRWAWAVTALYADGRESLPFATSEVLIDRTSYAAEIKWVFLGTFPGVGFNIYIGRGGVYGFLDYVPASSSWVYSYIDSTSATDLTTRPSTYSGGSISGAITDLVKSQATLENTCNAPDFAKSPPKGRKPWRDAPVAWAAGIKNLGDRVISGGKTYECIQPGNSYTAPTVSSGCEVDGPPKTGGSFYRLPNQAYVLDAEIIHDGQIWKCTTAGTTSTNAYANLLVGDGGTYWGPVGGSGPVIWQFIQNGTAVAEYPSVVTHFDQRRFYGGYPTDAARIDVSRIDRFWDFDQNLTVLADDAMSITMASRIYEEIRSILPAWGLLALGSQAEWSVTGSQGYLDSITPMNRCVRQQSYYGSSWLDPLMVGSVAVFLQALGNVLRDLSWSESSTSMAGQDLTVLARHLFDGYTIVDWDYAELPHSTIWAVRSDGVLLSCAYIREQQVVAWAQHTTDGLFENVSCIPEGTETAVYVVVKRTIGGATKRYVERFATRQVSDYAAGIFLDSSITYSGAAATHITGLSHLEGKTVNALADGNVVTGLVISGGAVDLPADLFPDGAVLVHVGLPYVSDIELLDLPPGAGRNRVKAIKWVGFEFTGSRGGYVGQDFDHLEEFRQRDVEDDYGAIPLEAGLVKIPVASSWNTGGRAVLRQVDPLPITILAITREVEYGGS